MKVFEVLTATGLESEAKYRKFIAAIDNSVAKRGLYGLLSEYIEGSAEQNADDTLGSRALTAYGTRSDEVLGRSTPQR